MYVRRTDRLLPTWSRAGRDRVRQGIAWALWMVLAGAGGAARAGESESPMMAPVGPEGGRATVTGTLIGALIIQLVRYTLLANGVPDDVAKLVKAALIVLAVWLQRHGRA